MGDLSSDEEVPPLASTVEAEVEARLLAAQPTPAEALEAPKAAAEPPRAVQLSHVAGLENLGNTCFFNSVLQNLCGLDALAAHFTTSPLDEAAPLTAGLRQLLRAYAAAPPGAPVKPSLLHGAIVKRAPRFKGYGQQDAQELLMTLLDGLQWEEMVAARAAAAAAAAEAARAAAEEAAAGADAAGAAADAATANGDGAAAAPPVALPAAPPVAPVQVRTFVDDLFGGMLASTIVCGTCHTASTTMEPFMDVSLPIPAPAVPPASSFTFNSRFSALNSTAAAQKQQPSKMASMLADAAEARAAASKKNDKAASIAAAAAATTANNTGVRMSGKARKKAEKLARRNAKRVRKPRTGGAKALSSDADADAAAPATAPDSPRSTASSTTSSSGGDGDDDDELSDASSPAPPAAAAAAEIDSDSDGPQPPAPTVITLGPAPAPSAAADDNWLEMVDDSSAAAEELKRMRVADTAADADAFDFAGSVTKTTGTASSSSGIMTGRVSALSPLRLQPLSELAAAPAVAAVPQALPGSSPDASVLSCLAAFVSDEQLTGACRYACEACARAAAASAAARRAKSVRWAPQEALESVRLIPPRPDDYLPPTYSSESSDEDAADANADGDALLLPLSSAIEDEDVAGEAGSGPLRDLASRFDEAAGDAPDAVPDADATRAATDSTLAAAAAGLAAMTLSGGARSEADAPEEGSEAVPVPDATPSPPGDAQPAAAAASDSPAPGATAGDEAAVAATPAPAPPPPVLRDAVKRLRFTQLPRCLVVHLKRFRQDARGRTSKIGGHVAFEESLDLAPYWSPPPPACNGGDAAAAEAPPQVAAPASLYRLQGVVEHSGGLHGGHYVAFVRRGADWHYASDRHVRPATLAQALSSEAYLLFYARDDVVDSATPDAPAREDAAQGQDG